MMKEVQKKIQVFSGVSSGRLARIISSNKSSFTLFICTLTIILVYRIQLTLGLFKTPIKPFDFNPASYPTWFMLSYFPYDLLLVFFCSLFSWLLSQMEWISPKGQTRSILKTSRFIVLHMLLFVLLLIHSAHTRLLFDAQTGLDYSIVKEACLNVSFIELDKFIDLKGALFLFIPFGLFWAVLSSSLVLRLWMIRISTGLIVLLILFSLFTTTHRNHAVPAEIRLNPALFLLSDIAENGIFRNSFGDRDIKTGSDDGSGIQPAGKDFKNQIKTIKFLPPKKSLPWNIVFFIMESVGTRYVFDTDHGHPMPMPFLHGIAKKGWHLKNHYTVSNISTKAVFSLLSGIYDFFGQETFCIRPDAHVPSLKNFLGEEYDSFLVTPSPIQWYFPVAFVKNSGLTEMHHYGNLNFKIKEELHSFGRYVGRDEIETVHFFIQRLEKAKEPFLGIYYSFTAHLPYFDYGPDYRIRKEDGRMISRYYNNLNLLDQMLKRIYDRLDQQGLLERTLFVIVGDHGQAFGQHHPDNFMHHRYSYNENLETPAILYQPALFKPKTFEFPTSHVDILPTLLDALGISYDPLLLDGESLFQNRLKRKYIFFYGHEGSISSLDDHLIKVQYSLKKKRCQAFNLKADPEERNPVDCSLYEPQFDALKRFVRYHDLNLVKYNERIKEKRGISKTEAPQWVEGR